MTADELTPREVEVLALLEQGMGTNEIAGHFCVSPATARNHIQSILGKLDAHSRLEAVARARRGYSQQPADKALRILYREGFRLTEEQRAKIREAFPSPSSSIPQQPGPPVVKQSAFTVSWTGPDKT